MEETPAEAKTEKNILLEWESPARPYKSHSRDFYRTIGALSFLVIVILVFMGEFLLIGVILATLFVIYALSAVPPTNIRHKITNLGIETGNYFHRFEEMMEFWFDEKYKQKLLVIRTLLGFPSHLQLLIKHEDELKIKNILSDKLPYRERPEKTWLDRASDWLVKNIPLERTS